MGAKTTEKKETLEMRNKKENPIVHSGDCRKQKGREL